MKKTTYLFHAIDIAKNKIQYDTEVKRILSDKSILAWIVKSDIRNPLRYLLITSSRKSQPTAFALAA